MCDMRKKEVLLSKSATSSPCRSARHITAKTTEPVTSDGGGRDTKSIHSRWRETCGRRLPALSALLVEAVLAYPCRGAGELAMRVYGPMRSVGKDACRAVAPSLERRMRPRYIGFIVSRRQCRHANGGGQEKPGLPPFSFLRPAPELEGLAVPASSKSTSRSAYVGQRATTRSTAASRLRSNSSSIVIAEKPGHSFPPFERERRYILLRLHARPYGRRKKKR